MTKFKYLWFFGATLILGCQSNQVRSSSSEELTKNQYVMILDHIRSEVPSAIIPFKWDGQSWKALPDSSPTERQAYIGKKWISKFTSESPMELDREGCNFKGMNWFKSPLYCLSHGTKIKEGNPSSEFSGWSSKLVPRPIVFVEGPNSAKSFILEKASANEGHKKIIESNFISQNKYAYNCSSIDKPSTAATRLKIAPKNIKLVSQFSLGKEGNIVTVQLDPSLLKCDGPMEEPWLPKTYFISSDNKVTLLGNSLVPLDAGDFNGDGKTEMIFFSPGYNEDGYVLYFDNFSKSEKFSWHYH